MKINKPSIVRQGAFVRVTSYIETKDESFTLWCELPAKFESILNQNNQICNTFLLALLPTALVAGENIEVDGFISKQLAYQLENAVIPTLLVARPDLKEIKVKAHLVDAELPKPDRTESSTESNSATGFSGGIDSFHTVAENMHSEYVGYTLKSIVINNVNAPSDTFSAYANTMQEGADDVGLELIAINTNFSECLRVSYYSYNMFYNISLAYLMDGYIRRYYLASGYDIDFAINEMYLKKKIKGRDLAIYENMIVPMLSTENQIMVPFGSQYTRMQKVVSVANFYPAREHLNVCMRPGNMNCGRCGKCTRTMLALDVIGVLKDFDAIFDVSDYMKRRKMHIIVGLLHWSPYQQEIIAWADQHNVYLAPKFIRIVCRIIQPVLGFFSKTTALKSLTKKFYRGNLRGRTSG